MDQREERDRKMKMEQLSNDISQVRLEMKIRRDPETEEVYSYITKKRICRKLLLLKRITVQPEQIRIRRLAASILTRTDGDDDAIAVETDPWSIREAGSYTIELELDNDYDYTFEFRLNVRYNDIERDNKTPFSFMDDDKDSDDDDEVMDDDAKKKRKSAMTKEFRTNLKKWNRGKRANIMLDHLVERKSRYSDLYRVSKLDLTPKQSKEIDV